MVAAESEEDHRLERVSAMKLFIQFDLDTEHWEIMCEDSRMRAMPAGPRLYKAPPHPDVEFRHLERQGAERAIATLEKYFAGLSDRKPTKKQEREFVA